MDSFNLNDEILYKEKYLKYKNKYVQLKNQIGGSPFDKNTYVLLYQSEALPELDNIKREYIVNSNSKSSTIKVTTKDFYGKEKIIDVPIEKYMVQHFHLDVDAVNGLSNIYFYKTFTNQIKPIMVFNFSKQEKLIKCIKGSGLVLPNMNFGTDKLSNSLKIYRNIVNDLSKEEVALINPLNEVNLEGNIQVLKNKINENSKITNQRIEILQSIRDTILKPFAEKFRENLEPSKMRKGWSESGDSITMNKVDSYIVVKDLKFDDIKGISFTIINIGNNPDSNNKSTPVEQPAEQTAE